MVYGPSLRPDRRMHGDEPLVPWYLRKLREYEKDKGIKLLDVLDLHFYPQANGVYGPAADADTAALRLRSTRSLWDASYKEESWIKDSVRLISRMKEWIAQNYPGLRISIGEYSFGGEQHMSGALALAEALGRFGSEGVDYAFYWTFPPKSSKAFWAFRSFRNFDGKGGKFLERSMKTQAPSGISLFASRDETGKHLVAIALNMDPKTAARATLNLRGCRPVASRRGFTYASHTPSIVENSQKSASNLQELLPPYSINVIDIILK
jgi:hypothetical protein